LDRALELFLKSGFEVTTIATIAAAVGMAKRSVYARYPNKAALFKASVQRAIEEWTVPVEALHRVESDDLEATLTAVARIRMANATTPAGLRLQRIINTESYRFPEIFAQAFEQGTRPTIDFLANLLRRHMQAGAVSVAKPERMSGFYHAAKAVAPVHARAAEDLVHMVTSGQSGVWAAVRVLELTGSYPDQLAHVCAVVLRAHRLAARPVDDDRRQRGDLHGADAEFDVVILVDRVVVVGLVRMQHDRLALQHHFESIGRRAAFRSISRADADDRERDSKLLGDPSANRFAGDLGEAVVGPLGHAGSVRLGERPLSLILVYRARRAIHEPSRLAAVVQQFPGIIGVGVLRSGANLPRRVHGGMENVVKSSGTPERGCRRHVELQRRDARRPPACPDRPAC
jgi:TetR/AcrR family transcriptional repressor of mexJK operon